ncbi:MAG: hypothetical protein ISQ57_00085 [Litoricola sp.]|nr:hypothetical protein [Litorivicinus sp.]
MEKPEPRDGRFYPVMRKANEANNRPNLGLIRLSVVISCIFLSVAILNLSQTSLPQWQPRPPVTCDNGDWVHRFARINANRVNIRDLPTVFSTVLTQKNRDDAITVVCEFGVWSRIDAPTIGADTWISSGLITLEQAQPLSIRMKGALLFFLILGSSGLIVSRWRPSWIESFVDLLLQTQQLPAHARPLISVQPQYHPVRDRRT